ncbi:MAG: hypothetical protein R3D55_27410 [Chloroflexota bacterium]
MVGIELHEGSPSEWVEYGRFHCPTNGPLSQKVETFAEAATQIEYQILPGKLALLQS